MIQKVFIGLVAFAISGCALGGKHLKPRVQKPAEYKLVRFSEEIKVSDRVGIGSSPKELVNAGITLARHGRHEEAKRKFLKASEYKSKNEHWKLSALGAAALCALKGDKRAEFLRIAGEIEMVLIKERLMTIPENVATVVGLARFARGEEIPVSFPWEIRKLINDIN